VGGSALALDACCCAWIQEFPRKNVRLCPSTLEGHITHYTLLGRQIYHTWFILSFHVLSLWPRYLQKPDFLRFALPFIAEVEFPDRQCSEGSVIVSTMIHNCQRKNVRHWSCLSSVKCGIIKKANNVFSVQHWQSRTVQGLRASCQAQFGWPGTFWHLWEGVLQPIGLQA